MRGIVLRTLIIALGLWFADFILGSVTITGSGTLLIAALLLCLVNAFVRLGAELLTFPLTIITLGFFLLVINAAMFGLVAAVLDGFAVSGFLSALFGAIIVSLISTMASWFIGPEGRYEVLAFKRRN